MNAIKETDRIFVAGHRGLVGSAIVRNLTGKGYRNVIVRNRAELDLQKEEAVVAFFASEKPEIVIVAAADLQAQPASFQTYIEINTAS